MPEKPGQNRVKSLMEGGGPSTGRPLFVKAGSLLAPAAVAAAAAIAAASD
jgi:hypothetical protein